MAQELNIKGQLTAEKVKKNEQIKILITANILRDHFKSFSQWVYNNLGVHRFIDYGKSDVYIEAEGDKEDLDRFLNYCNNDRLKMAVKNLAVKTGKFEFIN